MTITLPDGREVTEIVLPDGSTATQVIAPDGSVVFDAGSAIPDSGLARYEFEQDLTDSWNNNDLTDNGGITFQSGGQVGTYYALLDGIDDYATAPFQFDSSEDFSVVGWVYFESFTGDYQPIFAQRDGFSTLDWVLALDTTGTGSDGWQLLFGESIGANYSNNNVSAGDTTTGTWVHVGLTKGGDTWTFYTDGTEQFKVTDSTGWTTSETLYIGAWQDGDTLSNMRIDQNDWFTDELTATEVSNHESTGSING